MKEVIQTFAFISLAILGYEGTSDCNLNLVTGPYGVSDDAFSASSTAGACSLEDARINSSKAWCPVNSNNGHYLQVEFRKTSTLRAIQTRGKRAFNQWVTSYSVNTSFDGLSWSSIVNSSTGTVQVFPGNFDRDTIVTNTLEGNVVGKFIRVKAVSGYSDNKRSMRLEVLGCPISVLSDTCQTCKGWKARLGATGDVLKVLEDTVASNPGMCGLKCVRQSGCDSFLFDVSPSRCKLLTSTPDISNPSVDLTGLWYFINTNSTDLS